MEERRGRRETSREGKGRRNGRERRKRRERDVVKGMEEEREGKNIKNGCEMA